MIAQQELAEARAAAQAAHEKVANQVVRIDEGVTVKEQEVTERLRAVADQLEELRVEKEARSPFRANAPTVSLREIFGTRLAF